MGNRKTALCSAICVAALTACIWPALSQLKLTPRSPDEPVAVTYNERLSVDSALEATQDIDKALQSFRKLTALTKGKVTAKQLKSVGNTDAEVQTLAFKNWVTTVEGALRKQRYTIAKLDYEIAKAKSPAGKPPSATLKKQEARLRKAEKGFQKFWDNFGIAD